MSVCLSVWLSVSFWCYRSAPDSLANSHVGRVRNLFVICVLVARLRRCLTLSNPVPWQNWMAAYLGYTLRMKTVSWLTSYGSWHAYEKKKTGSWGRHCLHVTTKQVKMAWVCFKKGWGWLVRRCLAYEVEGIQPWGRHKKTWTEVVYSDLVFCTCMRLMH